MGKLYEELKRRKVFRVGAVYAVVAWVLIQVADVVLPTFGAPTWVNQTIIFLFILGFLPTLIAAWAYDITPEGIIAGEVSPAGKVTSNTTSSISTDRKLIYIILALVLVVAGFQFADRFILVDMQVSRAAGANSDIQNMPTQLSVTFTDGIDYRPRHATGLGLTLSPDGSELVFMSTHDDGRSRLILRELAQRELLPIPGTEGALNPFFSPDGETVGYFTGDRLIRRVTLDGRAPVTISDGSDQFSKGLWIESFIYFTSPPARQLLKVAAEGGPALEVPFDRPELSSGISTLAYIPPTGEILFSRGIDDAQEIILLNKESGETQQILNNATLVSYVPGGYLVFQRDQILMAARYDAATRRVGFAVPVLERFSKDTSGVIPQASISASGILAYAFEPESTIATTLNWVSADGTRSQLAELPDSSASVKLSPDGRFAAIATEEVPFSVYLWDMTLQVATGLEIVDARTPSWHPDGRHLIFGRDNDVVSLSLDDSSEEVILAAEDRVNTPSLSPDGETIVYSTPGDDSSFDLHVQLLGETTPQTIIEGAYNPVISPNGQWLAYNAQNSVYIARFPSGAERRRVSIQRSGRPQWRSDGKALYFISGFRSEVEKQMQLVEVESTEPAIFGTPQTLFLVNAPDALERPAAYSNWGAHFQASADGSQFLMVFRPASRTSNEIVIAQNWTTELERLLPSDDF